MSDRAAGSRRGVFLSLAAIGAGLLAGAALAQRGVQINADADGNNISGDAANEPSFAINPLNPQHMVVGWRQFPTINSDFRLAGYAVTLDGGKTWFNGGTLQPPPGSGNANMTDPVIKVDRNGVFYYNSMIYRSSRDGQTVYHSDDGGFTWAAPVYIRENCFCDKNWYEIDDRTGHHYGIWQIPGEFARSTDGGQTWSSWSVGASIYAYISVGPDSELYIGWWGSGAVVIRRSDNARDPGQTPTFTSPINVPMGSLLYGRPINPDGAASQINTITDPRDGPTRGWVYMLTSAIRSNDVCDVMFARSADGGRTFSTPIRVNDDPPGQDYQWMAAMSMAPSGRLDAVWFDTRGDPSHFISRLYYSHSWDNGATWSPNRPVGDPFDPRLGYPVQRKIGDYFQSQSDNGSTSVVHPATFNGEQDIYYARLHPMVMEVSPLRTGQPARFDVSEARPNERTWVVYSLDGDGYTHIGPLDVPVNIARPRLALGPRTADASGNVSWTVTMPPQSQGRRVWFQAVQRENASNVVDQVVQ